MHLFTKETIDFILRGIKDGKSEFEITADLGKSKSKAEFDRQSSILKVNGEKIDFGKLPRINETMIYYAQNGQLKPLIFFSQETNRVYKLIPTKDWPSVSISGVPMHQITRSTPKADTISKINLFGSINKESNALDTCFGAGYTALELSKHCRQVITFEIDENMLEMARLNPYSKHAFETANLKIINKSVFEEVKELKNSSFDIVMHDPPTFKIAPELYSEEFYSQLKRIMKDSALLYHYMPMPGVRKGKDFSKTITLKLKKSGFEMVRYSREAQGALFRKL